MPAKTDASATAPPLPICKLLREPCEPMTTLQGTTIVSLHPANTVSRLPSNRLFRAVGPGFSPDVKPGKSMWALQAAEKLWFCNRARLQSCRKWLKISGALAPERCFSAPNMSFSAACLAPEEHSRLRHPFARFAFSLLFVAAVVLFFPGCKKEA